MKFKGLMNIEQRAWVYVRLKLVVFFCLWCFEVESHCVAQASFEFIFLVLGFPVCPPVFSDISRQTVEIIGCEMKDRRL